MSSLSRQMTTRTAAVASNLYSMRTLMSLFVLLVPAVAFGTFVLLVTMGLEYTTTCLSVAQHTSGMAPAGEPSPAGGGPISAEEAAERDEQWTDLVSHLHTYGLLTNLSAGGYLMVIIGLITANSTPVCCPEGALVCCAGSSVLFGGCGICCLGIVSLVFMVRAPPYPTPLPTPLRRIPVTSDARNALTCYMHDHAQVMVLVGWASLDSDCHGNESYEQVDWIVKLGYYTPLPLFPCLTAITPKL